MLKICYTLQSAKNTEVKNTYFPFIVCQEFLGETFIDDDGNKIQQTRRYLIFKSFESYYDNITIYNHCHELIIPQTKNNSMIKTIGRLVFDFDIPLLNVPSQFESDMIDVIKTVFRKFYKNIDCDKFVFVWLDSSNSKKTSIHLIVKNACFGDDWISQIKLVYLQIEHEISQDNRFSWVKGFSLIDTALSRENATLRMPLNSKIGGSILKFRYPVHTFQDGLVCLYDPNDKQTEQMIYDIDSIQTLSQYVKHPENKKPDIKYNYSEFEKSELFYERCFQIFKQSNDKFDSFAMGERCGRFINLIRKKPSICIVGGRLHENENAYLYISPKYDIYYFCRRSDCLSNLGRNGRLLNPPIPTVSNKKIPILFRK